MSQTIIDLRHDGDFTVIRLAGELTYSKLFCLSLLSEQYTDQETKIVVIEVTDDFTISNEAKKLPKKNLKFSLGNINVIVAGPKAQTEKLMRFLSRFTE
ncbi:MAG: hypothetical protein K6T91_01640 [Firmicutes bacterium]|nr:hypothetical protein [Bacillota bacterium]